MFPTSRRSLFPLDENLGVPLKTLVLAFFPHTFVLENSSYPRYSLPHAFWRFQRDLQQLWTPFQFPTGNTWGHLEASGNTFRKPPKNKQTGKQKNFLVEDSKPMKKTTVDSSPSKQGRRLTRCQTNQKIKVSWKLDTSSREKVYLRSQSASFVKKSSSRNQEKAATAAKFHLYQQVLIFSEEGSKFDP